MSPISLHTLCLGWLLLLAIALAPESASAHIGLLYPPARGGPDSKNWDWKLHQFIGFEGFKYPCGGYPMGPVTELRAGQLIQARFWTRDMLKGKKNIKKIYNKKLPSKSMSQARHGGGMCEFSLSYDGGKNFRVIATYTKTCPDVAYDWPVRIPDNVPSCDKPGQCLLAWSWTSALVKQFYHNCADVRVQGVKNGRLPSKKIRLYNFGRHPYKTFPGDGTGKGKGKGKGNGKGKGKDEEEDKNLTGPGPNKREVIEASRKKSL
ncbi:MAG: hypothetical protein J3Q66DRAFT_388955 [Benniella sp.]|nr:MAG: hypothetical protein J3Q66DRAFT_388955 [Benniella sp.]